MPETVVSDIAVVWGRRHIPSHRNTDTREPTMTDLLEKQDAFIPTRADAELAAESSRILAKAHGDDILRVRIGTGEELVLPKAVTRLLCLVLTEMSNGNAVNIIPVHAALTTQEAADFLNVSRPHLIKLLERGAMPHHMVGTHRRVKFQDLYEYKKRQQGAAKNALDELAHQAQELNMGY